jgi:hypothetical protein
LKYGGEKYETKDYVLIFLRANGLTKKERMTNMAWEK